MAKTIKFNLICDNESIRTINDLQNNFSIEDILAYYNNKLLHRWLKVRGYSDELQKVSAITCEKSLEVIKELIKIFDVTEDEQKITESVYMLEYLEERKKQYDKYEKEKYNVENVIKGYEAGYRKLVDDILVNPDNVARIKANITELAENYGWVLKMHRRKLFYILVQKSELAVMCLLMNEQLRKYYLPSEVRKKDGTTVVDTDTDADKAAIFKQICKMVGTAEFKEKLGDNLLTFSGITDGYWKDLEPRGRKYMIICMGAGDYVRAAGESGGDMGREDINNKFVIIDGIDYKSNTKTNQLFYMEV